MNVNDLRGKKIALAASGGLDSMSVTKWLDENDVEVISVTADLGQQDEENLDDVKGRMLKSGAKEAHIIDLKDEIAKAGIKLIQSSAFYEGGYWNTTGIARHVTVSGIVDFMRSNNIDVFAHGATGRGNDQVRFSLVANMIEPSIKVYAPWRDENFINALGGRKQMIDFCLDRNLPIKVSYDKPYSTDANLLGLTHEAGKLESLDIPASFIKPIMGNFPKDAPSDGENIKIEFNKGIPCSINEKTMDPYDIIHFSNEVGGKHGIGIGIHTVENRFVGIKSRGVYESPGLVLLSTAYEFLLQQILDRKARNIYNLISNNLAEQIYQGYFYDLKSKILLSALQPVNELANGVVEVLMYKGNISFVSSKNVVKSLYDPEISSMEAVGDFNHQDSEGFINVLGINARALNVKGQTNFNAFDL